MEYFILFAAGILGGILAGMLGIGGGMIYIVVFAGYLNKKLGNTVSGDIMVKLLIANAVFSLVFVGIAGTIKNYFKKTILIRSVILIAIPAALTAVSTTFILSLSAGYDKSTFAILFIILIIPIIARMIWFKKENNTPSKPSQNPYKLSALGFLSGIITALSGLGGGFVMVPTLSVLLQFPIRKAMATSLAVIGLVSLSLSVYNMFFANVSPVALKNMIGPIILPMALPMVAGVLLGTPLGVIFAHKLSNRALRLVFLAFCLLVIIKISITLI